MDNTSLFRFNFVDREEPKKIITSFLKNETNSNILWLKGVHGVGKTFLLNNINSFVECPKTVYIELCSEESEHNCLFELLKGIGEATKFPFIKFFKKNYMEIISVLKSTAVFTIKQISNIDLTYLANSLFDASKLYVCAKDDEREHQNSVKMLTCYLDEILLDSSILIILDNFSLCDKGSLSIILDLILNYQNNITNENQIYFILSTTSDIQNTMVATEIKEKLPACSIELNPFKEVVYFYNILNRIFNLSRHIVNDIFTLCEGNPQRLKDFIHKLYDSNGIDLTNNAKPIVNLNVANEIICSGSLEIDIKKLTPAKRIILSLLTFFGKSMTIKFLIELAIFVLKHLDFYPKVEKEKISEAIFELYNENIIIPYNHNDLTFLKIEHDLKFESIRNQLEKEPFRELINNYIFQFLNSQSANYINDIFTERELEDSIAFHAFMAKVGNWQILNLECALKKYRDGLYENSCRIFDRIQDYVSELSYETQLRIADCYFQNGSYIESQKILNDLYNQNRNQFNFEGYCLYAKVESILINKKFAIDLVDMACNLTNITEIMRLKASRIKQQALINLKTHRGNAKEIFDDIKENISTTNKKSIEYSTFLISTVEFYRGELAQNDLKEAEKIALLHDDQFLLGIIYFNMGFDDFWEGNFSKSKDEYKKSYNILNRIRQHESAYVLNNFASHLMIENKIDEAIKLLYKALLWAQTDYSQIVIKTQLMVCYSILLDEYCLVLADEIRKQINSTSLDDISAYIKFTYNLGFAYKKMRKKEESNQCFYNAISEANKIDHQNLPHTWIKEINEGVEIWLKTHLSEHSEYLKERFDPWLLTLNHY